MELNDMFGKEEECEWVIESMLDNTVTYLTDCGIRETFIRDKPYKNHKCPGCGRVIKKSKKKIEENTKDFRC